MYVCVPCVSTTSRSQKRKSKVAQESLELWSYKQMWATMWVLGTEPGPSARAGSAPNCIAISISPSLWVVFIFKKILSTTVIYYKSLLRIIDINILCFDQIHLPISFPPTLPIFLHLPRPLHILFFFFSFVVVGFELSDVCLSVGMLIYVSKLLKARGCSGDQGRGNRIQWHKEWKGIMGQEGLNWGVGGRAE